MIKDTQIISNKYILSLEVLIHSPPSTPHTEIHIHTHIYLKLTQGKIKIITWIWPVTINKIKSEESVAIQLHYT